MANTISELYEKYAEQVEGALEEDRYFQYLFEMVQAGENTIDQKNRVLHKVVDETWLKVIEEGIDAIFNIVDQAAQVHHDIGGGRARSRWRRRSQRTVCAI